MEKIITIILFCCATLAAEITITGKKMELRPRQNLVIFTDGAIVTHSSFTLKADKIIRDDTSKEIKASGKVEFNSTNYSLTGDTADYSILKHSGMISGAPASAYFTTEKEGSGQLVAKKIIYTTEQLSAMDEATLSYAGTQIKSRLIHYNLSEKKVVAEPVSRLTYNDSKYTCDFSAGRMTFTQDTHKIKLTDDVKGTIIFKKTQK